MAGKNQGAAAGTAAPARKEKVDGVAFEVYPEKLRTWRAVQIARQFSGDEVSVEKLMAMISLVELSTSLDEEAIVEHCGGQDAMFEDVLSFVADVVKAVFPKN